MKITVFDEQTMREAAAEELPALLAESRLIWVDMIGPAEPELAVLRDVFHFHPLAIEDTHNHQQRPKLEQYENTLFIILNSISGDAANLRIQEIDAFIGAHYLVTVHQAGEPAVEEALRRLPRTGRPITSGHHLFYVLADTVVDRYFPVLDSIEEAIDILGDRILTTADRHTLNALFDLKQDMIGVWRVVWPQREVLSNLLHLPDTREQIELQYYLRDVLDHLMWIADMVNTLRDVLTSMMDLYMSATSNRLNIVVNRLTVITVCIGVLTVFSGFYGMNFPHTWPPFDAEWGIPFVVIMMVGGVILLMWQFRRRDWM